MAKDFILPDIGEGIVECEVVEWLVQEGDTVKEDQPICDVMTDKALVQIPAVHDGVITKLHCKKGDIGFISNNNSNLNFDKGYCRSFANSRSPTYLCKNPFYCESDEWSDTIVSIAQNTATFDHCMYGKGYNDK